MKVYGYLTHQTGHRRLSSASTTVIVGHCHCQPSWSAVTVGAVSAVVVRSVIIAIHQGRRSWLLPYQQVSSGRSSLSVVIGHGCHSNRQLSSGWSSLSVVVSRGSCSNAECEICGQGRAKAKKLSRKKCTIIIDKRSRSIVVNIDHCCQGSRSYERPHCCHQSQRRAWLGPSHCK
jgi:hypothetical protein